MAHLHLTIELPACRCAHEYVHNGQIVVDWCHNKGVASPQNSCGKDGDLLMGRNQLSGLLQVTDVRKSDHPFERGRPEKDRERSSRVHDEALGRLRER